MTKKISLTTWIWFIYLSLVFISFLAILSSSVTLDLSRTHGISAFTKQIVIVILGTSIIIGLIKWGKTGVLFFYNTAEIGFYIVFALTIITAIMGKEANASKRYITLPVINMAVNTFELAKISTIIFLAKKLTEKYDNEQLRIKKLNMALIPVGIMFIAMTYNNLSTGGIFLITIYLMLWLVKLPKEVMKNVNRSLAIMVVLGALIIAARPHAIQRSGTWNSRIHKFLTNSYNETDQGLLCRVAIAKTGLIHFAPGKSSIKYLIPLSYTDYIYAIIAEETGLVALLIPILYLGLFIVIAKIAFRQKKPAYMIMILGFGIMITVQAFVHIFVNIGWMPETGQTLPFISLGGTSFMVDSAILGLILAIHKASLYDHTSEDTNPTKDTTTTNTDYQDIIIDSNII